MNRFKSGQKVVCIGQGNDWHFENQFTGFWIWRRNKRAPGPKKGDVVTVVQYDKPGYMFISGYSNPYRDVHFEAIQENVSAIELVNKELCQN